MSKKQNINNIKVTINFQAVLLRLKKINIANGFDNSIFVLANSKNTHRGEFIK